PPPPPHRRLPRRARSSNCCCGAPRLRRRGRASRDDRERARGGRDPAGRPASIGGYPGQCDASNGGGMTDAARFDELIHPATRLSIVALLAAAGWGEWGVVRG